MAPQKSLQDRLYRCFATSGRFSNFVAQKLMRLSKYISMPNVTDCNDNKILVSSFGEDGAARSRKHYQPSDCVIPATNLAIRKPVNISSPIFGDPPIASSTAVVPSPPANNATASIPIRAKSPMIDSPRSGPQSHELKMRYPPMSRGKRYVFETIDQVQTELQIHGSEMKIFPVASRQRCTHDREFMLLQLRIKSLQPCRMANFLEPVSISSFVSPNCNEVLFQRINK